MSSNFIFNRNVFKLYVAIDAQKEKKRLGYDNVQSCWNSFESKLLRVIDKVAPMTQFINKSVKNLKTPVSIRNKINCHKRVRKKGDPEKIS